MSDKISRRDFIKLAGLGGAVSSVLTGCGTAARYVRREPYADMPEYTLTGKSTYFATTCGECPAGCGLVVRTVEGRAKKVDGNPAHPVNAGNSCQRGQATLQGLYNPDRIQGPGQQAQRGSGSFSPIDWNAAIAAVQEALSSPPGQVAFLLGRFPDHLFDLVQLLAGRASEMTILRYGLLDEFDGAAILRRALGEEGLPWFDIEHAAVTFSFGANFAETWVSPMAYARAYGAMRQGSPGQRGYLVQFEPRMSLTAANADEWIPIVPGSEALLAGALGRLVGDFMGGAPAALAGVDVAAAAAASGVAESELYRLARLFADAPRKVAVPGGAALGHTNGLAAAQAILALNVLVDNLGQAGGVFILPGAPLNSEGPAAQSTLADISALIARMNRGEIKTLFVHGVNPVYALPEVLGFASALANVPRVISFSPFLDETALQADFVLPDHTPLESWGYQKVLTGGDRVAVSALQPVVTPLHDTRSTVDVLLAAAGADLGYADEVDYLQKSVTGLLGLPGSFSAASPAEFWARWLQHGGWWSGEPLLQAPAGLADLTGSLDLAEAAFSGAAPEFDLYLLPFPHPSLGDGSGANRPWLQETPDPMTSVMWNSWVQINPNTAHALGVKDDDVVRIASPVGEIEAVVYIYPAIHPQVVAVPLGQGHTALGRWAQGRGANPMKLLDARQNEAGGLAFMATRVKVTPTGRSQPLARYESRAGVYGEH